MNNQKYFLPVVQIGLRLFLVVSMNLIMKLKLALKHLLYATNRVIATICVFNCPFLCVALPDKKRKSALLSSHQAKKIL